MPFTTYAHPLLREVECAKVETEGSSSGNAGPDKAMPHPHGHPERNPQHNRVQRELMRRRPSGDENRDDPQDKEPAGEGE